MVSGCKTSIGGALYGSGTTSKHLFCVTAILSTVPFSSVPKIEKRG